MSRQIERTHSFENWLTRLCLLALLSVGGWLRFSHLDWDGGYQLHPDERAILFVAERVDLPSSWGEAFDARRSPANPFNTAHGPASFPYGHLPVYATAMMHSLLELARDAFGQPMLVSSDSFIGQLLNLDHLPRLDHLMIVGRALSALADVLTIAVTHIVAGRLGNRLTRAIASSFVAFAVIHIQNAHFGTIDSWATLFSTLALGQMVSDQSLGKTLLAGLFTGLAIACKLSAAALIVPYILSRAWSLKKRSGVDFSWVPPTTLGLAVGLAAFAVTNPYAILDAPLFVNGVVEQAGIVAGWIDVPYTRQYVGTMPILYAPAQQARWQLGAPLAIASWTGIALAAARFRNARPQEVAVVSWGIIGMLAGGIVFAKFPRYTLLVTPALCVLAARLFTIPHEVEVAGLTPRAGRRGKTFQLTIGIVTVAWTAVYAFAFVSMYDASHPWIAASRWIYANIPERATLVTEFWDDALPLNLANDSAEVASAYQPQSVDWITEPDSAQKLERNLKLVASADYVILASSRLYGPLSRLRNHYPLSAAYYRALFAGNLGFKLVKTFERYPSVIGLRLVDDPFASTALAAPSLPYPAHNLSIGYADESFTVYDHPRAFVFQNIARLPAESLLLIVSSEANNHTKGEPR